MASPPIARRHRAYSLVCHLEHSGMTYTIPQVWDIILPFGWFNIRAFPVAGFLAEKKFRTRIYDPCMNVIHQV